MGHYFDQLACHSPAERANQSKRERQYDKNRWNSAQMQFFQLGDEWTKQETEHQPQREWNQDLTPKIQSCHRQHEGDEHQRSRRILRADHVRFPSAFLVWSARSGDWLLARTDSNCRI